MGTVMCDSRLQAILLLCAAVSVSAELLVEDPDGEGGKVDAQRGQMEPEIVTAPTIDSWKLNFRLKKDGGISRIFPTSGYSPQYSYHLRKRGRVGRDPNDWIRLLKKQQEDGTEQIVPIPQVLRLGKRSLKGIVPSARTDPYWLSYWNSEPKWEDSFQSWQKAMIAENQSKEAQKTDMRRVLRALGAMIAEDE